jgi:hypothetical protein
VAAVGVGVSAGHASFVLVTELDAVGCGVSAGTAFLTLKTPLAAVGAGVSSGTASLSRARAISATGTGVGAGHALVGSTLQLSATGTGISAGIALPQVPGVLPLAATGVGVSAGTAALSYVAITRQLKYRWRLDDGSESGATWDAAENTIITVAKGTKRRWRVQLDNRGDPAGLAARVEYRRSDIADSWKKVPIS